MIRTLLSTFLKNIDETQQNFQKKQRRNQMIKVEQRKEILTLCHEWKQDIKQSKKRKSNEKLKILKREFKSNSSLR